MQEKVAVKKEREPKDDGRYIIFYTFEDEDDAKAREREDEG